MIGWFNFNNFPGFVYIVFIFIALKLIVEYINKKKNEDSECTQTTDNCTSDASTSDECDSTSTIPNTSTSITDSDGDVVLEIKRDDLLNTIISIRKLQHHMRKIKNKK